MLCQMLFLFKHDFTSLTLVNVYSFRQHAWSISHKFHSLKFQLLTQCCCAWTVRCFFTFVPQVKTLWHFPHLYCLFSIMNSFMLFQVTTLKWNTYHKSHTKTSSRYCQNASYTHHFTPRHSVPHWPRMSTNLLSSITW